MSAPQVNGPSNPEKFIDTIDPDDPEYQRQLRRPAEVKEDVKQMEDKRRVSLILNSEAFRRELEEIVDEQIKSGPHPASLLALQQITDLLLPHARLNSLGPRSGGGFVIPVSDIHGPGSATYCKGEKLLRCKLASLYRLVDLHGWNHSIYNHISVRINQELEHFLLNPFGLLYSEVTASSLVKVDMRGEVIDQGATTLGINKAGFTLHSAIHQARPDIRCIIHLHTPEAVAVSSMKCGFLPLSQEALICGEVSYHDYNGILVDENERDTLQRNLGPMNKVMFLRNHGLVACGGTIEEAYHYAVNVMSACQTQVKAVPAGLDNLILVDSDIRRKTFNVANQGGGGVDTGNKKWKIGELEFEALMRQLDNNGYRTGYMYRQPILKNEKRDKSHPDVEEPPSSSSFTYIWDGDYEHSKYASPLKTALERQKQTYKAGWLNTPNTYMKQEMDETGTQNPKKITKWVADKEQSSPTRKGGTAIKLENANQFAPIGSDPKEFKNKQKMIRKDYYEEKISAGPQSKVLEGITWEEAQKLKAEGKIDGTLSMTGDSVIVIGAASKGIIQRDQQHNVQVYHSQYQANPFEAVTQEEIESYRKQVEKGQHPEQEKQEEVLEPGPEGKLISSEERMQAIQQQQIESSPQKQSASNSANNQQEYIMSSVIEDDDEVFTIIPVSPRNPHRVSGLRLSTSSRETNIDDILDPYDPSTRSTKPSVSTPQNSGNSKETLIDDVYTPPTHERLEVDAPQQPVQRSESVREPPKSPELISEMKKTNFGRSKSERKSNKKDHTVNGDEKPTSPKSDTLRSQDSASGGEGLDERSSKEGSPTKEHLSPSKDKKGKKKKFRMPSFGKTKNKESKESAI